MKYNMHIRLREKFDNFFSIIKTGKKDKQLV